MPILFFAAAGALVAGGTGGGWYMWKRGQQEAAKRLQHEDAEAAKQALRDAIDLADLRSEAKAAGLDPDEVVAGYEKLRDSQLSTEDVLKKLGRAAITG
ncbi:MULTISPECIES: hypothetical protein [unclassified Streptomyces]|uniref:hypothetical protein n=1 Tax=unclassified Streptomyces TaxID=2593676 RepID=UPI00190B5B47|nr:MULTISPECIES: hypothetical protein [unclassified Streptomyces]MBK3569853.1 hypothetical protein [Streptomyces sp. MBT62]WOX11354.1 hypothetical protein R2B38_22120 [Streptomyces sp. N50]